VLGAQVQRIPTATYCAKPRCKRKVDWPVVTSLPSGTGQHRYSSERDRIRGALATGFAFPTEIWTLLRLKDTVSQATATGLRRWSCWLMAECHRQQQSQPESQRGTPAFPAHVGIRLGDKIRRDRSGFGIGRQPCNSSTVCTSAFLTREQINNDVLLTRSSWHTMRQEQLPLQSGRRLPCFATHD